jgi:hypothetical protein
MYPIAFAVNAQAPRKIIAPVWKKKAYVYLILTKFSLHMWAKELSM